MPATRKIEIDAATADTLEDRAGAAALLDAMLLVGMDPSLSRLRAASSSSALSSASA